MNKSRVECEAFVVAEADRAAFSESHYDAGLVRKHANA